MNPDPITYPQVKLGEQVFAVRYRAGDVVRMAQDGIELGEVISLKNSQNLERIAKMLHHGIAHAKDVPAAEILEMIPLEDLALYSEAITEALSKVSPQAQVAVEKIRARTAKLIADAELLAAPASSQ